MNDNSFKKQNRLAACTIDPLESLIPKEIRQETLLKIKQESIDTMGEDLTGECKKRLVCLGKTCLGRPLPFKSPTAQPYINELARTHKIVNMELVITTSCQECPIAKTCSSTCNQINNFIERDKIIEPPLVYKALEEEEVSDEYSEESEAFNLKAEDIPWDCLSETRAKVVKMYLYEQKDFKHIANLLGLNNQATCKYEFYAALTQLSETAIMRKFMEEEKIRYAQESPILTDKQFNLLDYLYLENKSLTETAKRYRITKQAVQQMLTRVIKKHKIKWTRFVYKKGNKVVYNVPQIFK